MKTVSPEDYRRISAEIRSDSSPVGIDAEKTHVIILRKLEEMEETLRSIEARLG